jgi:hypothetical protein
VRPARQTLSLTRVLWARLGRSRADALAYALSELQNTERPLNARLRDTDIMLRAGGSAVLLEAEYQRTAPTMAALIRHAATLTVSELRRAPNAEECYSLLARGYRICHLRPEPQKVPKKTALWMQMLEPASLESKP